MMEYEIRPMAASKRISDTLPRSGRVNEVCKEWLVHEDEALAYRLQKQEVEEHYTGNRYRNAQVREDFPKAKIEQEKELEEATSRYQRMVKEQAEIDSSYARQIAAKLEQDEKEKIRLEVSDKKIAKKIQNDEVAYARQVQPCVVSGDRNKPLPNVNEVGLPLMEAAEYQNNLKQANFAITHNLRALKLIDRSSNQSSSSAPCDTVDKSIVSPDELPGPSYLNSAGDHALFTEEDLKREAERRLQEERDAELAKLLQEQEEEINQEAAIDRDRLLAIEAQDKELAKLLQEKEKARLRRARERAKQKALLKKQLQQSAGNVTESGGDIGTNDSTTSDVDNSTLSSSRSNGSRISENDNSESGGDSSSLQNIAIAIDPTYQLSRSDTSFSYLDNAAPPYMPIQGQRRTSSWEKKQKKSKHKDGCKQQ